ncbi:MAG: hypothetical protein LH606_20140 [Cytophagaceae bacterium]|nr:hypothetical protein [Cytophagaceae bacterium]
MIPIQNLYYLLCYAWDVVPERDYAYVDAEADSSLFDLLINTLINGVIIQAKNGFPQEYAEVLDAYPGVKGKINFNLTLLHELTRQGKTICAFDEFAPNQLYIGIIKTTLINSSRTGQLSVSLRKRSLHWIKRFADVNCVSLSKSLFYNQLQRVKSPHQRFLLHICQLIHENLLVNEQKGSYIFKDFWRDEKKMAILFEAFVRNFYRIEQKLFTVRRETVYWQLRSSEFDCRLLPLMRTDITLENPERKLIIDTKFYAEIFQSYFNAQKLHSPHLYQLFAYLKNQSNKDKRCGGILLYPTVSQALSSIYSDTNLSIRIETINLNQPWQNIKLELLRLIA